MRDHALNQETDRNTDEPLARSVGDLQGRVAAFVAEHPNASANEVHRVVGGNRQEVLRAVRALNLTETVDEPGTTLAAVPSRFPEASGAFGIKGVTPHKTGLHFDPDLPFEDWEKAGLHLGLVRDWSAWALGDWILAGEDLYGERYAQGVEATGRSETTLMEYARVSRCFPDERRRTELSFTHHQLVAPRPPEEQDEWLDAAEANRWSAKELRGKLQPEPPPLSTRDDLTGRLREAIRAVLESSIPTGDCYTTPADLMEALQDAFIADVDHRHEKLKEGIADAEVKPRGVVAKLNAQNAKLARRGRPTKPTLKQQARLHAERQVETSTDRAVQGLRADLAEADRLRDRLQPDDPLLADEAGG